MKLSLSRDFFYDHPVFRYEEVVEQLPAYKGREQTLKNLLQYHKKCGHIVLIQKHLYAVVQRGSSADNPFVDHYLLASKLASDAVIGYQSALDYHGCLHSARFETVYLTQKNKSAGVLNYQGEKYRATKVPCSLIKAQKPFFEVNEVSRINQKIRVTSLERTFVDILNRPFLLGYDWEEIARSLQKVYIGRPSVVVEYLKLLESPITAARVGYFIERDPRSFNIKPEIIDQIHKLSLKSLTYLDSNHAQENVLVKKWNLMVPKSLEHSTWEEPLFHE